MTIKANILLDSIGEHGCRLTTFELIYPRFILAEVNTHRALSKSSASSRAIPFNKMAENIKSDPAQPIVWGRNIRGMQAEDVLDPHEEEQALRIWRMSMDSQIKFATMLAELNVHKSIVNRLIEPFVHMKTILSGTDFGNFFNLRAHKDAQPEFQELAFRMLEVYENNKPKELKVGEWHIPYGDKRLEDTTFEEKKQICTARCARVSYENHNGEYDKNSDLKLFSQLTTPPLHASPLEHLAECLAEKTRLGNFIGWKQYRKFFEHENRAEYSADNLLNNRRTYAKSTTKNKLG